MPSTNFLAKRCAQHFLSRTLFSAIHFRKVQNILYKKIKIKNGPMPHYITFFRLILDPKKSSAIYHLYNFSLQSRLTDEIRTSANLFFKVLTKTLFRLSITNRNSAVDRSESSDSLTHLDQPCRQESAAHAVDPRQANGCAVEIGTEQKLGIIGISPRRIGVVEGHPVVSVISKLFQNLQHDIVCLNKLGLKNQMGELRSHHRVSCLGHMQYHRCRGARGAVPPLTTACAPHFGLLKIRFWSITQEQDNNGKRNNNVQT